MSIHPNIHGHSGRRGGQRSRAQKQKREPRLELAFRFTRPKQNGSLATNRLAALHEYHGAEECEAEEDRYGAGLWNCVRIVVVKVRHAGGSVASGIEYQVLVNVDGGGGLQKVKTTGDLPGPWPPVLDEHGAPCSIARGLVVENV